MANLTEQELLEVNANLDSIKGLNQTVIDSSRAVYLANQLKTEVEAKLQEQYKAIAEKYNDGAPIQFDIKTGEVTPIKDEELK
jgi:hypothetical protein